MEAESLSESAAVVKIFKHFFDASVETKAPDAAKEKDEAMVAKRTAEGVTSRREGIANIKADIVELRRRLAVLEQAVVSGLTRPFASSRISQKQRP